VIVLCGAARFMLQCGMIAGLIVRRNKLMVWITRAARRMHQRLVNRLLTISRIRD
jgi:hypothetical protein